ncbi:DUF1553 domain-containing protein, partial [bacterium]|nr:DUF1553 domain-containing protein [bacterium]
MSELQTAGNEKSEPQRRWRRRLCWLGLGGIGIALWLSGPGFRWLGGRLLPRVGMEQGCVLEGNLWSGPVLKDFVWKDEATATEVRGREVRVAYSPFNFFWGGVTGIVESITLAEQDPIKRQADIIDEQIDTVGRAILGLTVACARCHDHKFDPVSQRDYYALAGIFHSTSIENGQGLETESEAQTRQEAQVELAQIEASIVQLENEAAKQATSTSLIDWEAEDFDRGNVVIDTTQYGKGIGIVSDPGGQLNFAEYDFIAEEAGALLLQIRYAAAQARPGRVLLDGEPIITPALEQVTGGWEPEHQAWSIEGVLTVTPGPHTLRIESEPMMSHLDKLKLHRLKNAEDAQVLIDLTKRRQALKIAAKKEPNKKVMSVRDGTIAHAKLNRRGNPHDLGDEIPRGMLEAFGANHTSPGTATSGRRELAEWLVTADHPLTSRVLVNRVWRWHFGGQALVDSPDDFGTRGRSPTHPALLDFLAKQFTQDGWSLKSLHKTIVMSRTWQRSGHHPNSAAMNKTDPENTLYWKRTPHRLEAEAFR